MSFFALSFRLIAGQLIYTACSIDCSAIIWIVIVILCMPLLGYGLIELNFLYRGCVLLCYRSPNCP